MSALTPFGVCIRAHDPGQDVHDVPVSFLRDLVRTHHLVLLRNFMPPPTAKALTAYGERWGTLMLWPFGSVLEVREAARPTDHVFDHSYVPFHWDGMYVPFIPEFQIFQCVSAPGPGDGGRTTFCDTARLLRNTSRSTRERWEKVTVTYQIADIVRYAGTAVSPLIARHPTTREPILRYSEPPEEGDTDFLNRTRQTWSGIDGDDVPAVARELEDALYDPRHIYGHAWHQGDIVIADNYTLLHGREAFVSQCSRHLRRVHVLGDPPLENPAMAPFQG